jgi:hypothetical protein
METLLVLPWERRCMCLIYEVTVPKITLKLAELWQSWNRERDPGCFRFETSRAGIAGWQPQRGHAPVSPIGANSYCIQTVFSKVAVAR